MYYELDSNNNIIPSTFEGWCKMHEDKTRNRMTIGKDEIGNIYISTVFLGLDHGLGSGKPLLFESMIFGGKNDLYQQRYHTYEEALKGHEQLVRDITLGIEIDEDNDTRPTKILNLRIKSKK